MTHTKKEIFNRPLSREAKHFIENWVSGNLNTNYSKNSTKRTTIFLPKDLHKSLKIKAANLNTTMTTLIVEALKTYLK